MNKKILALSVGMLFSGLVGVSHAAQAPVNLDLTASGHILQSSSCKVDAPTSVEFDNLEMVQIGTVESQRPLKNGSGKSYDIYITDCPANEKVSLSILGTASEENSSLIALNDVPGSAQHVAVGIWQDLVVDHLLLKVNDTGTTPLATSSSGGLHYPLIAAVAQTDASQTVVAGTISANMSVKVNFL
jgi:type 1 fimbria pilin